MSNVDFEEKILVYNKVMRRTASPVGIAGIMLLAVLVSFSGYLISQDVSWDGYLSGLMLNFWGGEEHQLIRVNLHNHSIALYQSGVLYKLARVAGTGNPNNGTATPTGKFRILSKDKWHISSQRVIMPWSLRFSDKGYCFHDIPLTLAGARINTTYSHGCVRLPTVLAQEMFAWTNVGAYVEIYDASLARADGTLMVYLLNEDGSRVPIATEADFVARGYRWEDVAVVPAAELDGLPLAPANSGTH